MALNRTSRSAGKKPAGAANAAAKKSIAKKNGNASGGWSAKPNKKGTKTTAAYSTIKARQMALERLKRSIWAALNDVIAGIIQHATAGNVAAAKELFDFAGVYSLPLPDGENAPAAPAPAPDADAGENAEAVATEMAPVHPIDLFFKKLGIPPSNAEPESGAA